MSDWRRISLWLDQLDEPLIPRAPLTAEIDADVAIIGAGYTGLWTAYYLKTQAPHLRIVVVEAEIAGFGASGRNGGWLMGNLLNDERLLGRVPAAERAASSALLHDIPDEVGRVIDREGIACDYRKGGVLYCAARYPEQRQRLLAQLAALREQGQGEDDYRWLEADELAGQLRVHGAEGALYSPHCATIQPARLVRGLAAVVERLGVKIYEQSRVLDWQPGQLRTEGGSVRCDWLVPAVEGYAARMPALSAHQLPVQSLLIATEPLTPGIWNEIGLARGQAFSESSRQVTYGQRTADDRLVFGARGGYRFGGRLRENFQLDHEEVDLRRRLMLDLFPILKAAEITHTWGGNLGMARRFQPHMLCDRQQRIALSGGYGGEGVGASNLGGRTLADLILGHDTPLTRQPWVLPQAAIDQLPRWEPEPLRWLGYNAIISSFVHEDRVLAQPYSAPWRRRLAMRLATLMEGFMR